MQNKEKLMRTVAIDVTRVQTGVRLEKRLVKVLKALAELQDLSLGDLIENLVHHAFAGRVPFGESALVQVRELMRIYGVDADSMTGASAEERS
jgi:predicted DNA-binding ribbon-helix-helix protein